MELDVGEKGFELTTDARKVRANRLQFDVMSHIDRIEAESIWGRLDRKCMSRTKIEIGHYC